MCDDIAADCDEVQVTEVQVMAVPVAGVSVTAVESVRPVPVMVRLTLLSPPEPLPRVAVAVDSALIKYDGVVSVNGTVAVPPPGVGMVMPIVPVPSAAEAATLQFAVTEVSVPPAWIAQVNGVPVTGLSVTAVAPVRLLPVRVTAVPPAVGPEMVRVLVPVL